MREFLGEDLAAGFEGALPGLTVKKGKKRERPFENLTFKESISELAGMNLSEAEMATLLGDQGAAALQARFGQITNYIGKSPVQAVEQLEGMNLRPDQLMEFLPRQAFTGYSILSQNKDFLKQVEQDIIKGQETDFVSQIGKTTELQPRMRWLRDKRVADAEAELAAEEKGITETTAQTIRQRRLNEAKEAGVGEWGRVFMNKLMGAEKTLDILPGRGGPQSFIDAYGTPEERGEYRATVNAARGGTPIEEPIAPRYREPVEMQVTWPVKMFADAVDKLILWTSNKENAAADKQVQAAERMNQAVDKLTGQRRAPVQAPPARGSGVDRG